MVILLLKHCGALRPLRNFRSHTSSSDTTARWQLRKQFWKEQRQHMNCTDIKTSTYNKKDANNILQNKAHERMRSEAYLCCIFHAHRGCESVLLTCALLSCLKLKETEEKKSRALLLPAWGLECAQGIISIIDLHASKIQHFCVGKKTELITTEHETHLS